MNESALQWLTNRASLPGTLACGLRRPDGQCVSHSPDAAWPAATVEKILAHFESLTAAMFTDSPAPRWSTWAFEQGHIRFVKRADSWCLALIVRAESEAIPTLDSLSHEFLTLQLDN